jgi:hypothetical protein
MAGSVVRCAGIGGKFFAAMAGSAGGTDVGICDICLAGNQNDTIITGLYLSALAEAPNATIAPPGWAVRWALLSGPDVMQNLAFILASASTVAIRPLGATNGEYAIGTAAGGSVAALNTPTSSKCLAQGFVAVNVQGVWLTFPSDPEAPGAIIIPSGDAGQLIMFGPSADTGGLATGTWNGAITIRGGPIRKVKELKGKGLPVAHLEERG